MSDEDIDLSDIPELTEEDFKRAKPLAQHFAERGIKIDPSEPIIVTEYHEDGTAVRHELPPPMNKNDELKDTHPEYDFSGGVRGKHFREMHQGYRVTIHDEDGSVTFKEYAPDEGWVALDPDVRRYFPDSESVNRTLRSLIALIPDQTT